MAWPNLEAVELEAAELEAAELEAAEEPVEDVGVVAVVTGEVSLPHLSQRSL